MSTQTAPSQQKPIQEAEAIDLILFADESFDRDNPCDVPVPTGLNHFEGLQNCCVDAMASGKQFDMSQPCAACGKPGHTFDDCPVLNNVDFLRKHCIQFRLFLKRNTMEDSAAQINSMQVDSSNIESPDESVNDTSEEDFCQGQE